VREEFAAMRRQSHLLAVVMAATVSVTYLRADETDVATDAFRSAISKSIPQLEKGAAGSAKQRKCFTCHNQAMPVLALVEAGRRGFAIDEDNLQAQIKHTVEHLQRGRQQYLEGRGQGGKVLTAGYALWALQDSGREADETTAAVTHFLLEYQHDKTHWSHPGNRPPSSGSDFTTSYVALRGLAAFGTSEQATKIAARTKEVGEWLLSESPRDTEDRVFRLRALEYIDAPDDVVRAAISELIESQRSDGGWSQTADMESDAYATGTVLVALLRAGAVAAEDLVVRRGVKYLLDTQLKDGTWHVVSRAKPFQTYFESGFPHGKDQFISIAASSWATLALLLTLPEPSSAGDGVENAR
jgi:N-acyl-D-amino-acid deacylase